MTLRGSDPESYIAEHTLVFEGYVRPRDLWSLSPSLCRWCRRGSGCCSRRTLETMGYPNPQHETRNREPGTRNLEQGTRNSKPSVRKHHPYFSQQRAEREFLVDNLLVRFHFMVVMIGWTGLAPWEFPFPGSLTSTFLGNPAQEIWNPKLDVQKPPRVSVSSTLATRWVTRVSFGQKFGVLRDQICTA